MQKYVSHQLFRKYQWSYSISIAVVAAIAIAAGMSGLWVPLGVVCAFTGAWMAWRYIRPYTLRNYLLTGVLTSVLSHLLCVTLCVLVFSTGASIFGNMFDLMEYVLIENLLFLIISLPLYVLVALLMWWILVHRHEGQEN